VLFLQKARGFDLADASQVIAFSAISGVLGTVLAGWLSDRVFRGDRVKPAVLSGILGTLSLILFLFVGGGFVLNIFYVSLFSLATGVLYCIVAGLMGANRLLGNPFDKHDIVNLANKLEGHPDNTTPAILGGLVASAVENRRVYSVSVPVAPKISFAVFIPPFELKTEVARGVLPEQVSRANAVYNLSRSALMTASLFSGNFENLRVAVQDTLHQPYRHHFIPGLDQAFRLSYELGSYGTYISGAGPSIISIIPDEEADDFNTYAVRRMAEKGFDGWQMKVLKADPHGAGVFLD
jgi:homoserine kinase